MLAETPFQVASTATIQPNAMSAKRGTGSNLLKQNAKDALALSTSACNVTHQVAKFVKMDTSFTMVSAR